MYSTGFSCGIAGEILHPPTFTLPADELHLTAVDAQAVSDDQQRSGTQWSKA